MLPDLADLILAAALTVAPTDDADVPRYEAIAADLAAVVLEDGADLPIPDDPESSALLVLAIASRESRLDARVDRGELRGSGVDACLMQIRGSKRQGDALVRDRRECFRRGMHIASASLSLCAHRPRELRLSAYASGRCSAGGATSRGYYAALATIERVREEWRADWRD